jgi:hypothetical protein
MNKQTLPIIAFVCLFCFLAWGCSSKSVWSKAQAGDATALTFDAARCHHTSGSQWVNASSLGLPPSANNAGSTSRK